MITLAILGLIALAMIISGLLWHQHIAKQREEKRLALLDKGIETINKGLDIFDGYLGYKMQQNPLPLSSLPAPNYVEEESGEVASQANSPQIGKVGNPQIGMGNGKVGNGKIPFNQITDRRQRVYDFYIQYPNATLAEAEDELDIPDSTIDRIKRDLIGRGVLQL